MKIDIFTHILPEKYMTAFSNKNNKFLEARGARNRGATVDLKMRLRLMDRYPDVLQVLTISSHLWRTSRHRMKRRSWPG